jgi:hypothetical protein
MATLLRGTNFVIRASCRLFETEKWQVVHAIDSGSVYHLIFYQVVHAL